jgi:hypothetical protein
VAGHGLEGVDAGNDHHAPGAAAHEGQRALDGRDEGVHGDREGAADIVLLLVREGAEGGGRGIRDQDVHAAEDFTDALEDRGHLGRLGQLEGQGEALDPFALDLGHDGGRNIGASPIGDDAVGARAR